MSIIHGPLPWLLVIVAATLTAVAARRWPRVWFRREIPIAAAIGTAVAVVVSYALHHVGGLIADATDDYPRSIDLVAAVAVLLLDIRTLLGDEVHGSHRFASAKLPSSTPTVTTKGSGPPSPLTTDVPDRNARRDGELLSQVPIDGRVSGFAARPGYVYLPPAYFATPRSALPVLVLLAGVPGQPKNWLDGLNAQKVFADYAQAHGGRAPILVFADYTGGITDDRGCIDSAQGQIETYLTVDVPAFVHDTFSVTTGPASWGIGGFSDGGTCALMIGLRHSDVYGPIVAFSPDASPSCDGARDQYITRFLAGDVNAFTTHDPLSLLRGVHAPPTTAIYLEAGYREPSKEAQTMTIAQEAQAAGIPTQLVTKAGRHAFDFWRQCIIDSAPWIGTELHA
jgi:enterochelin esterase-like enzyme